MQKGAAFAAPSLYGSSNPDRHNCAMPDLNFSPGLEHYLVVSTLLFSLGVLGEYVARIFNEVKGRPLYLIAERIEKFGLRLVAGTDYHVVNVEQDDRYRDFWQTYHQMTERKGVTQTLAKIDMHRRLSLIGTMLLHKGDVDGLICGTWSTPPVHLQYVDQVIGHRAGVSTYACMNGLLLPDRQVFLVDTHLNYDPSAEQLAEITVMAAEEMLRFGIRPKAALLSHSNFGSSDQPTAIKMRQTLALVQQRAPWLEIDGEMHGDVALDGAARKSLMPHSTLEGNANLLVLPNLDAANIAFNLLKTAAVAAGACYSGGILRAQGNPRRIDVHEREHDRLERAGRSNGGPCRHFEPSGAVVVIPDGQGHRRTGQARPQHVTHRGGGRRDRTPGIVEQAAANGSLGGRGLETIHLEHRARGLVQPLRRMRPVEDNEPRRRLGACERGIVGHEW